MVEIAGISQHYRVGVDEVQQILEGFASRGSSHLSELFFSAAYLWTRLLGAVSLPSVVAGTKKIWWSAANLRVKMWHCGQYTCTREDFDGNKDEGENLFFVVHDLDNFKLNKKVRQGIYFMLMISSYQGRRARGWASEDSRWLIDVRMGDICLISPSPVTTIT